MKNTMLVITRMHSFLLDNNSKNGDLYGLGSWTKSLLNPDLKTFPVDELQKAMSFAKEINASVVQVVMKPTIEPIVYQLRSQGGRVTDIKFTGSRLEFSTEAGACPMQFDTRTEAEDAAWFINITRERKNEAPVFFDVEPALKNN